MVSESFLVVLLESNACEQDSKICEWCPVVVIAFAVDPSRKAVHDESSAVHEVVNWAHLPIATGIMVVSLSGNVLPNIANYCD